MHSLSPQGSQWKQPGSVFIPFLCAYMHVWKCVLDVGLSLSSKTQNPSLCSLIFSLMIIPPERCLTQTVSSCMLFKLGCPTFVQPLAYWWQFWLFLVVGTCAFTYVHFCCEGYVPSRVLWGECVGVVLIAKLPSRKVSLMSTSWAHQMSQALVSPSCSGHSGHTCALCFVDSRQPIGSDRVLCVNDGPLHECTKVAGPGLQGVLVCSSQLLSPLLLVFSVGHWGLNWF